MKCSNCGTENRDSAKFCSLCGTVFYAQQQTPETVVEPAFAPQAQPEQAKEERPAVAPAQAVQPQPAEKTVPPQAGAHCIKCNAVLQPGATFCNVCGGSQSAATQAPAPTPYASQQIPAAQPAYSTMQQTATMAPVATAPVATMPYTSAPVVAAPAPMPVRVVCGKCGKPMAPTEPFCNKCGTSAQYNKTVPVRKPDNKAWIIPLAIVGGLILLVGIVLGINAITNSNKYNDAISLMNSGRYEEALVLFTELGEYEEAPYYAIVCEDNISYNAALESMEEGYYYTAKEIFDSLYGFKDSYELSDECQRYIDYDDAESYYYLGYYWDAYSLYSDLGDFKDSAQRKEQCIQETPGSGIVETGSSYYSSSAATITLINQADYDMYFKIYVSDSNTYWCSVFVRAGSRASVYIPSGTYYIKESIGTLWFGEHDMFGDIGYYGITTFSDGSVDTYIPSGYIFTVTYQSGYNYFVPGGSRHSF